MDDESDFTIESARKAAVRNELGDWVARFLASPGSDNAVLADQLSEGLHWWAGPVRLQIDELHRLAGPPGDPVLCPVEEEYWDSRVDSMDERVEKGWVPPPVIVSHREGRFQLEDGNHRVESVRQAGRRDTWAVVGFAQRRERDRFVAERDDLAPGPSS